MEIVEIYSLEVLLFFIQLLLGYHVVEITMTFYRLLTLQTPGLPSSN
jgi:hypothetical protein